MYLAEAFRKFQQGLAEGGRVVGPCLRNGGVVDDTNIDKLLVSSLDPENGILEPQWIEDDKLLKVFVVLEVKQAVLGVKPPNALSYAFRFGNTCALTYTKSSDI